jgi:hypothetical protein
MVLSQSLPSVAVEYSRRQRLEIEAAVAALLRQWSRMGSEFDASWLAIEPTLLTITGVAQRRLAASAQSYVTNVLEETGQVRAVPVLGEANLPALVGVAGDGRPAESLLYGSVVKAKQAVGAGATVPQALQAGREFLSLAGGSLFSDTARQSESLGMGIRQRPVSGYVRMLQTPSCPRCVILAGKWFKRNQGFQRHPGCDCRHIPTSEGGAGDLTLDPAAYVESLSDAELDAWLGKAGAEAVREGADLAQVVNARRGMKTAQIGGRQVWVTTEGTTRRGLANRALVPSNSPRSSNRRPRLMPEHISSIAKDRDDYLRLLRANGYLL